MPLSVRDATPADYTSFARLFPALRVPDPLPTPAQFEAQMLPRTVVADDGSTCVAYAHWRFYGQTAHVVHIVVDEHARGRGVGRALMDSVRDRIVAAASTRWYLNVKKDNAAAIRLYERCGLAVETRGWSMRAGWSDLLAFPGASDAIPYEPTAVEAAELAARLGVDPERLALVRARAGNVFVALRDEAGGCAFGVLDPAFPGIYPIALERPAHGRPLFDALHRHARDAHVNVFVEGDAAIAEALLAAGATLSFEIVRMGASLVRS